MYLHIGGDVVVALRDLVAIVDVTSMDRGNSNHEYLKKMAEKGIISTVNEGVTNAWVITTKKVYASPISSLTLKKRAGFLGEDDDEVETEGE